MDDTGIEKKTQTPKLGYKLNQEYRVIEIKNENYKINLGYSG